MIAPLGAGSTLCLLAFDASNRLAVRKDGLAAKAAILASDVSGLSLQAEKAFAAHTIPVEYYSAKVGDAYYRVFFSQVSEAPLDEGISFASIESLQKDGASDPTLCAVLSGLEPYLNDIPYLHLGENDFIYKFRPDKDRNRAIYAQDPAASALYQSKLCAAIKAKTRQHERTATAPLTLDFGAVRYVIPSHFGFCLGVKNAIERAYETLAENPGRRVFMLSELIHNPFVNEDLLRRGLRYLQSDKGAAYRDDGSTEKDASSSPILWDSLTSDDIVIIPAFGATDEDKRRLVRKGIGIFQYDATCMLVEKVWKAARGYGRDGYTVVIHGKHEHEETKATFSNTRRFAPAVIVRNLEEAKLLGEIVGSKDPQVRSRFYTLFAGKFTPGFDVERDLQRIAVVNQTTLLMNETREIITFLREVYLKRFGADQPGSPARVGGAGRTDTLCYATQVNQDALSRAIDDQVDAAFVVGGKNSSNTYQLYRLCEQKLGSRAFFIQSEANITADASVEHYVFPSKGTVGHGAVTEVRPLWTTHSTPKTVLITGGASCPDGIIQQVIARINGFFAPERLRDPDEVLKELEG